MKKVVLFLLGSICMITVLAVISHIMAKQPTKTLQVKIVENVATNDKPPVSIWDKWQQPQFPMGKLTVRRAEGLYNILLKVKVDDIEMICTLRRSPDVIQAIYHLSPFSSYGEMCQMYRNNKLLFDEELQEEKIFGVTVYIGTEYAIDSKITISRGDVVLRTIENQIALEVEE